MATSLEGSLEAIGVVELFGLIARERRTGTLEVRRVGGVARFGFLRGWPLADEGSTGRAGRDGVPDPLASPSLRSALFALVRDPDGSFEFDDREDEERLDSSADVADEPAPTELLARLSEWRELAEKAPLDGAVFRAGSPEGGATPGGLESDVNRGGRLDAVWKAVDGRRRVADLAEELPFELPELLALLVRLQDSGWIVFDARATRAGALRSSRGDGSAEVADAAPAAPERTRTLRQIVTSLVPVAVLAVIAAISQLPQVGGAPAARDGLVFELPNSALARARSRVDRVRVRRAIEAFRLAEGRWPRELRELVEAGVLPGGALTAPSGEPYYYRVDGDGIVLLPPAHSVLPAGSSGAIDPSGAPTSERTR